MPTVTAPSARTRVRRKPERADYDATAINAIVDAALICSVAFQIDGAVHAIPTLHWRDGEHLYLHGAKASRMLKALTEGEACLTIALADGLVLARSAMHHSLNYRSVVIYGRFALVTDPLEKQRSLQAFIEGLYPGRWETLRPITDKELNATSVLRMPLAEASAKVRDMGTVDDEEDLAWPVWAGVIPLNTATGTPRREDDSVGGTVPATRFSVGKDSVGWAV
ncbi:pyridoxamine 5'-phosphate oxidase family protein [Dechloromonas agitata]|uniref:pyridoxamine 5'-phosphate oxidase family protein n=1 Tax=Dechloromonas agitata TaxID=73030 RepID=UPI00237DE1F3|nr:pyridoxamine 5'-phosphate oxidase family protein [Dechloromonas agitata]MDE1546753.1 pyridoxamine 5'-phosphate oxidase family protein [Dechloromonas agitata]